jgi:hypothetical protein
MKLKPIMFLMAFFVLSSSVTTLPGLVYGDQIPTCPKLPCYPLTSWVPAGPASDTIRYQMYASDVIESNAMCVGQPITCVPQIDLSDIPIPGYALSPAAGCAANCAISDPRLWVTTPTQQLGMLEVDFNHASTFWGVTFCNGRDGVLAGVTQCFDGPGGSPITATCPNANPANDCTAAAINIRQGIASLIDKVAFTIADIGSIGPGAASMDNALTPASNVLHSGYPNDLNNPCSGTAPAGGCTPGTPNCGSIAPLVGNGCNTTGPYCVVSGTVLNYPRNADGSCPAGSFPVGGASSWDKLATGTAISAFHYAADTTDSLGFVNPGQVDFCRAADHFIAAGLATGKNAACELTGESVALSGDTIVFLGRNSLGRHNLGVGLTVAICELVNLGSTTCTEVSLTTGCFLAQCPPPFPNTGCTSAMLSGCSLVGPNTGWNMYTGGSFFQTPTPDREWALYDGTFASNFCGGSPGDFSANYDYVCNVTHDYWVEQSQFLSTPIAAEASLQVAMDIFENHTFTISMWTPSVQYPYVKGWQGISNAAGIGTAQGNPWSLLNAWNGNPAVAGPTVRWGQKDATASINPFTLNTVVESDVLQEVYDTLLVTNPFSPTQILSWMVNSYKVETNAQDSACPTTYANARGTFSVGACVKMVMRGDIPWHDIYNCASSDPVCLTSHTVTASDVKFSFANFNATGSFFAPGTANVIDAVYNPNQLPSAAYGPSGGAAGAGMSETLYIYLHNLNAWSLNDITAVPIIPQRLWVTQTAPAQSNGVFAPCTTIGTPSCTVEPQFVGGGIYTDVILGHRLVGSGPFVCASGPLGLSGSMIGGGCTFNADGSAGSQAVPVGGTVVLRRFSTINALDPNLAYFRSNAKFLQFQWAAYPGGNVASTAGIISSINSCKANAAAIGGVNSYAACQHWNTPDTGLACTTTAGACIGVSAGGHGTLPANFGPVVTQIGQWIGKGQWIFGVPSYGVLSGAQATPQTLYEDGSADGSFTFASPATIAATSGTPATAGMYLYLSGAEDNNFTGTVPVTLTTVQSGGLTAAISPGSVTLTPGSPFAGLTLTISAATAGTYTLIVKGLSPNFPSVTVTITVTVT